MTDPVTANDSSIGSITTASTKNLLPPVLLSPVSGASGMPASVLLKWRDTNNSPREVKYEVRIKKAGGTYVCYSLAAGTTVYSKSGKTHYWSVMAIGNGTSIKNSVWPADFKSTT